MKLKARSEFPNVWGEYKNHSNPVSLPSKLYSSPALTCASGIPKVVARLTRTVSLAELAEDQFYTKRTL